LLPDAVEVKTEYGYGYTECGLIRINIAGAIYTLSYAINYCNPTRKCGTISWTDSSSSNCYT
ncbi:MAG: hypothetical protein QXI07_09525, partial [Pyrobaculum sp.]